MSFNIKFCPSCSTEKAAKDQFCASCGFDFSLIKNLDTFKGSFKYYLKIVDKSVFKYRSIQFLDENYNLKLDFKAKFVATGFKFEIFDSDSNSIYIFKSDVTTSSVSILDVSEEQLISIDFNNKTKIFIVRDSEGKILYDYSCYLISTGSYDVRSNLSDDRVKLIKIDNNNPRTIKISSNVKLKKHQSQIIIAAFYVILSGKEYTLLGTPNSEILDSTFNV